MKLGCGTSSEQNLHLSKEVRWMKRITVLSKGHGKSPNPKAGCCHGNANARNI